MKFIDLSPFQRSMLTMLCTGQTFDTACLGRGCNPKQDAKQAAKTLMDLREQGLVFSSQKASGQAYANWRATDYGKAVFSGRPDEVAPAQPVGPVPALQCCTWVVYSTDGGAIGVVYNMYSEDDATALAGKLAESRGRQYWVARLVAVAKPVTQPKFEIERL